MYRARNHIEDVSAEWLIALQSRELGAHWYVEYYETFVAATAGLAAPSRPLS
jgi:hypothetical protein